MSVIIPHYQSGSASTDSATGSNPGHKTVTFNPPFTAVPEIFIQVRGTTDTIPVLFKVTARDKTSFTVVAHKLTDSGFDIATNQAFSWIATLDET